MYALYIAFACGAIPRNGSGTAPADLQVLWLDGVLPTNGIPRGGGRMSAMRRIVLTGVCSLALVLTIGLGVSAASNGKGIAALLHPNDSSAKTGSGSAQNAHKEFTGTPFEFDPGHTGIVAGDWV